MQIENNRKWQIIGAGAIGCLWAANLIKSGQQVHLISRKPPSTQSLIYQNLLGDTVNLPCSISSQLINSIDPILVCVKAPHVKNALLEQRQHISSQQVIILMHNGMGCAEQIASIFPENPIICATTANACLLNQPLNIKQTGLGPTYLGPFNNAASQLYYLADNLNEALDNCQWCSHISQKLWLKLIINIAINPLTAIHQIKNGELQGAEYAAQIKTMIIEMMPILQMQGLNFERHALLTIINDVISATAENYSSMNRDIHFKRATENEYISGYILKRASYYKLDMPITKTLYDHIKALENHSLIQLNTE